MSSVPWDPEPPTIAGGVCTTVLAALYAMLVNGLADAIPAPGGTASCGGEHLGVDRFVYGLAVPFAVLIVVRMIRAHRGHRPGAVLAYALAAFCLIVGVIVGWPIVTARSLPAAPFCD